LLENEVPPIKQPFSEWRQWVDHPTDERNRGSECAGLKLVPANFRCDAATHANCERICAVRTEFLSELAVTGVEQVDAGHQVAKRPTGMTLCDGE
jgi:hypothetical protein